MDAKKQEAAIIAILRNRMAWAMVRLFTRTPSHKPMPRVSVVIPVFKAATTVEAAIRSILDQDFTDFEILAVYDVSPDDTVAILERMAGEDSRLRLLCNPDSPGLLRRMPAALNHGFEHAQGEYIARMDADDIALPGRLSTQIAFLDARPDVGMCGMSMTLMNQDGADLRELAAVCGPERLRVLAQYGPPLYHPTWMFRKTILETLKGYRDMYSEDYDFQLRALDAGFVLDNCPQTGLRYRLASGHRALLLAQKSNRFAFRMHRRRRRGQDDGFNRESLLAAVRPSRWGIERMAQRIMEYGFLLEERRRLPGLLIVTLAALFLPCSAALGLRKVAVKLQLAMMRAG
jgi:glycosyltransferase involved in cell wall biosynthesis